MKLLPLIFLPLVISGCTVQQKQVKAPNVIIIYTDDQRFDAAGFNGNPYIQTPSIDRVAQQGVRFTNAGVVFSLCSPSRAALLTGRYGSSNGVLHLSSRLNPGEQTIAGLLRNAGYQTAVSGKWHIGQLPEEVGFDFQVYFEGNGTYYNRRIMDNGKEIKPEIHCDAYCVNRSVDFIREAVKGEKPFFLFHNTQLPHMNGELVWDALKETKDRYNPERLPLAGNINDDLTGKPEYLKTVRNLTQARVYGYPDSTAILNHTRDYYSVITEMDQFLDKLFRTMDELKLWENTWLIFMGDNGWMLGEHGFTSKVLPYAPSVKVPLFIAGPGVNPGVRDELVLNIDILPSVLELAGVPLPGGIHGHSLIPLLKQDNSQSWRDVYVYEGLGDYGGTKPNLTAVNKDFRYIVTYSGDLLDSVIYRELYHQRNDPGEMNNLAGLSSMDSVISLMQTHIDDHRDKIIALRN